MFKTTQNLSDRIADHLIEDIICFKIQPGERLLEQKVAEELGVSRSPVREAFRILEKTGLVELVPRCGVKVSGFTEKRIDAYCDVFILLFGHLVRRCIENCDAAHRDRLILILEQMESCAENKDSRGFYQALLAFTAEGIESTRNPVLRQVVTSIMPNLQRLQYIAIMLRGDALQQNYDYFRTIVDALEEKDPDKGARAIEAYIRNEMEYTLTLVKNTPLSRFLDAEEA